jgi:hypothetical protein
LNSGLFWDGGHLAKNGRYRGWLDNRDGDCLPDAHIGAGDFFMRKAFNGRIGKGNVLYCPIGIHGLAGTHGAGTHGAGTGGAKTCGTGTCGTGTSGIILPYI